jgi:hypothetical protein
VNAITTVTTEVTTSTHVYCPWCTTPVMGQPVVALCGSSKVFAGFKPQNADGCSACETLAAQVFLPCGHHGEGWSAEAEWARWTGSERRG